MYNLNNFKKLFESFHEGIYIVDVNRKILYFNPAASKISGFSQNEMIKSFCYDDLLGHVDDKGSNLCKEGCPLVDSIKNNEIRDCNVYLHHKDGQRVPVHVRVIPYVVNNKIVGAIEVFVDKTPKNTLQTELKIQKQLSLIDHLTGLFNRRFLNEKLPNILKTSLIEAELGVIFIDIDDFKTLNDKKGHVYGDKILVSIAKTIQNSVGTTDYVVRFGGDEILVLSQTIGKEDIERLAKKISHLVRTSKNIEAEDSFTNTVSIGISILAKDEALLSAINRADHAMYIAKSKGKNNCVFLEKEYNEDFSLI